MIDLHHPFGEMRGSLSASRIIICKYVQVDHFREDAFYLMDEYRAILASNFVEQHNLVYLNDLLKIIWGMKTIILLALWYLVPTTYSLCNL